MALYSICQHSIHNIELSYDCYAISIVYQSMLQLFMSYAKDMVRPDDQGIDIGSLCFRACSSILLVHPKGLYNVTTRHVCVKICIVKINIWLW